jgi:hypothetical protein
MPEIDRGGYDESHGFSVIKNIGTIFHLGYGEGRAVGKM